MNRVALVVLSGLWLGTLSCRDTTAPTAPPPQPDAFLFNFNLDGLITCRVSTSDAAVATIGPEGGTINVGAHVLRIPPGALASAVTITARAPAGTAVSVVLEPEGLQFEQPALLTLSYADCGLLRTLLPKRIAYTSDLLVILSYIISWDNLFAQRVTGRLDHFSTYAVAW